MIILFFSNISYYAALFSKYAVCVREGLFCFCKQFCKQHTKCVNIDKTDTLLLERIPNNCKTRYLIVRYYEIRIILMHEALAVFTAYKNSNR